MKNLSVDHLGWAVNSIEKALPAMRVLGFNAVGEACGDTSRSVRILLLRNASGETVELVEPMGNAQTPISNFLAKNGPSPYHYCFTADRSDLGEILKELKGANFTKLIKETPAPALGGDGVIFLYSKEIGLVEVVVRESEYPSQKSGGGFA